MKKNFAGISKYLAVFLVGAALIVLYKTFDNLSSILVFFSTLATVIMLFIPTSLLERQLQKIRLKYIKKYARAISVGIIYIAVAALITLLLIFGLPALIKGVTNFVTVLPDYYKQLFTWINSVVEGLDLPSELDIMQTAEAFYKSYILPNLTPDNVKSSITNVVNAASSVINVVMALIVSIYMLLGRESLVRTSRIFLEQIIPARFMKPFVHYVKRSSDILYTYLYSQVLDALLVAVLMSVGLLLFKIPNALVLGFLIGLMNMIPYFGALGGGLITVVIVLLNDGWAKAIVVGIYILAMQQIDANVLQPRIVGNTVGIKPIYVLLAITIGGGFFGMAGIFVGVPCAAIIQMLIKDFISHKEKQKQTAQQEASDNDAVDEADKKAEIPVMVNEEE